MPRPPKATPYDDKINVWSQKSSSRSESSRSSGRADSSHALQTPSPRRSQTTAMPGYPTRPSSAMPSSSVMPTQAENYDWGVSPTTSRGGYQGQSSGHSQANPMLQVNTSFANQPSSSSSASYYAHTNMQQPGLGQPTSPPTFSRAGAETPMRYHWMMEFFDLRNSYNTRVITVDTGRFQVPVIGCPCGTQIQILYLPAFTLEPHCLNRQNILPLWNFRGGMGGNNNVWIEGPNLLERQYLSQQQCPQCGTGLRVVLHPVTPQQSAVDNSAMNIGYQ
ncbi:hypothetical protein SCHPADRAFT_946989 [Schizopora paradoxa]|uniref:Uncharacterized protein n=1 Tax=Schizopora paradoxa TaxID=27342 RepID=A0A0H2R0V1_9AGAM|nr:hypothetical protein SCHPADRAFT_946989 [Schizopora paradoxa]